MEQLKIYYIYFKEEKNYKIIELDDQLTENEVIDLLNDAGFKDVIIYENCSNSGLFGKVAEL